MVPASPPGRASDATLGLGGADHPGVCILAAIDYADLADKSLGFILALVVAIQFVGWGEEGMFRGIAVTTLREHGLTEGKVPSGRASSSCRPPDERAQRRREGSPAGVAVSFAGYFFYLIRRARAATS